MKCKITNNEINEFMNFGQMPLANGFLNKDKFKDEFFYKMSVGFSEEISLFQLNDHPSPQKMFNEKYPFFTSGSKFMINHFSEYCTWVKNSYLKEGNKVVEIGSNDGTMMQFFNEVGCDICGFEPSKSAADISKSKNLNTFVEFFTENNVKDNLKNSKYKIDAIVAANAICHVPNLIDLIKGVDYLLSKEGVFIFEEPYLGSMYEKTSYDQIYDEHIFIFSISSIKKIFELFNFKLVEAVPQITHGGSMRYVIARKENNKINENSNLQNQLSYEKKKNIDNIDGCLGFKKNCEKSRFNLIEKISSIKKKGKIICGYGATSKSTTVLNYCDIGEESIDCIYDTTPEKINKYSPGKHIPIKDFKDFYSNYPDYVYLFAWNHKEEIFKKESDYKGEWFSHVEI